MYRNEIDINKITESIIGAAIEVHRHLGPGLLEVAYEECLCRELDLREVSFTRQVPLPINYKGINLDCSYRLDLLVEDKVVVEIKAIEALLPIHDAQLLTYLKLGGWKIGLLINFNVPLLKDGIHRLVNGNVEGFQPPSKKIQINLYPNNLCDNSVFSVSPW